MPQPTVSRARRLPIGPHVEANGVHFRVWAPAASSVEAVFESPGLRPARLAPEAGGYFSGSAPGVRDGALYKFRLDGGDAYPDPASFFQPFGPHGASQVVDHGRFAWSDAGWPGPRRDGQVLYELHVGTFTPEGTWLAAARRFQELARLGITTLELMPVAEFPGKFGWGYDGVDWFAPSRLYGKPDDMRRFVDLAHAAGLAVVLDAVYNHFGPDGNYLAKFSKGYTTDRYYTEWGPALDFDGPGSGPVREHVLSNVEHWIANYHLDGLRIDATQTVYDLSGEHILAAMVSRARQAAGGRRVFMVAENEAQRARLLRPPSEGGYGFDAMWSDDFHHAAEAALTGRREGYYSGYRGSPQELVSAVKWGFLYQGQHYAWQRKRRGTPSFGLPAESFIHCLENHDQVANAPGSRRLLERASAADYRAMLAVLLLSPQTPALFQGQEYGAREPFPYFADHGRELAATVHAGRREFLTQFASAAEPEAQALVPDPSAEPTWRSAVLHREEAGGDPRVSALVRDLLRLRREDPVFRLRPYDRLDGAVLGPEAFVLRFFGDGEDRLLVVNLGAELDVDSPEPLLARPAGRRWALLWSSEDPEYGGFGTPPLEAPGWRLPASIAAVLRPAPYSRGPEAHGAA